MAQPTLRPKLKRIIASSFLAAVVVLAVWVFYALGGWPSNQAVKDFQPLAKRIKEIGGVKLCDNGDSGHGLDNTTPWYQVYYTVPDSAGLTDRIKSIASQDGYKLATDSAFINQLKGSTDQNGNYSEPYGGEQFNPKSDYLIGQSDYKTLKVTINRQTEVALYCGVKDYGKKQPTANDAILDFNLILPDTNK